MLGSAGYLGPSLAEQCDAVIRDYCRHWGTFDDVMFRFDCVDYDAKKAIEQRNLDLGLKPKTEVLIDPRSRIHRYITVNPITLGVSSNNNLVILPGVKS